MEVQRYSASTQQCDWNMRRNNLWFLHGTATYIISFTPLSYNSLPSLSPPLLPSLPLPSLLPSSLPSPLSSSLSFLGCWTWCTGSLHNHTRHLAQSARAVSESPQRVPQHSARTDPWWTQKWTNRDYWWGKRDVVFQLSHDVMSVSSQEPHTTYQHSCGGTHHTPIFSLA